VQKRKKKKKKENFTVSQKFVFFKVQLKFKFVFRSLAERYAVLKFLYFLLGINGLQLLLKSLFPTIVFVSN